MPEARATAMYGAGRFRVAVADTPREVLQELQRAAQF
jgi:hypothetical protein